MKRNVNTVLNYRTEPGKQVELLRLSGAFTYSESDLRYVLTSSISQKITGSLTISGTFGVHARTGNAPVLIVADPLGEEEDSVPYIRMSKNDQPFLAYFGFTPNSSDDLAPDGTSYNNIIASSFLVGLKGVGTTLQIGTNSTASLTITANGTIGVGTKTPDAFALLDLSGSNVAFIPPRCNGSASIVTPSNGMIMYNTATNRLQVYQAGGWKNITAA